LHPWVRDIMGVQHSPAGKYESLRWEYMAARFDFMGKSVLDIGANTGFFSLAALERGATEVHAYESNRLHAEFMREVSTLLGLNHLLTVNNNYFEFERQQTLGVDIILCLNVLHHLGDDFNASFNTLCTAKRNMGLKLRQLAKQTMYCWIQLGFNWKGDRHSPLFDNGLKTNIVDFVSENCERYWVIEDVALYDPLSMCYKTACNELFERFEDVGEFLNRPLFLLKSSIV
jgi:SAM-dependent methyltransferase